MYPLFSFRHEVFYAITCKSLPDINILVSSANISVKNLVDIFGKVIYVFQK